MHTTPRPWRWFKTGESESTGGGGGNGETPPPPTPKGNGEHPKFPADDLAKLDVRVTKLEATLGDGIAAPIVQESTGWTRQVIAALILGAFSTLVILLSVVAYFVNAHIANDEAQNVE